MTGSPEASATLTLTDVDHIISAFALNPHTVVNNTCEILKTKHKDNTYNWPWATTETQSSYKDSEQLPSPSVGRNQIAVPLLCRVAPFGSGKVHKWKFVSRGTSVILIAQAFFFLSFIDWFIAWLLCWVFVSVLGLSLVVASRGHSSLRCTGLSLSRPLSLRSTGSRRAGSVVVAHGPSCSAACGIFPDQGSNPCALHWQADSQPLCHQGSP